MTFGELKTELRLELFPQGEAPELVIPHNKSFISAVIDLQKKVECLQVNNTQIFEPCSTMFQCGMTIVNVPHGTIRKVSTFVRRDEDCAEDADGEVSWCDEIEYHFVDYTRLTKLLDNRLRCCGSTLQSLLTLSQSFCAKALGDAFPEPDDADYEGFPELPYGFHYPQPSTDSTKGRALHGVYAIQRGRIYIAPWLQSTEVLQIEWDGIKREWNDDDLVDDDPMFGRAVKLYVAWEHARDYEKSTVDYEIYEKEYREAVAHLIITCDDESKEHIRRPSRARMSNTVLTDEVIECTTNTTTEEGA